MDAQHPVPAVDAFVGVGLIHGNLYSIERLNDAVVKTIAMPDVRERLLQSGAEPYSSSVAEYRKAIAENLDTYVETMKRAGIAQQP